jgi:hypothetical protein
MKPRLNYNFSCQCQKVVHKSAKANNLEAFFARVKQNLIENLKMYFLQ